MGYPTSVFAPASRSNGQTIDAAHVNDVQAEVTAVENALLGTITHSVNITGASTLATLQCAGSTFSVRPVEPPPHGALVFLDSTATLGSSAESTFAFTGQSYITNSSIHSTGTNPARLTPQSTGVYLFSAQLAVSDNSTGYRAVRLVDSSGTIFAAARIPASSVAANTLLQAHGYRRYDALGGYAVMVYEGSGPSTLSALSGVEGTWFAMHKL